MFAKSSQLPAIVEGETLQLAENKQKLKEDYVKKEKLFETYYQVIYIKHAMRKGGLMHVHTVSSQISLCILHRLIREDTSFL